MLSEKQNCKKLLFLQPETLFLETFFCFGKKGFKSSIQNGKVSLRLRSVLENYLVN
jgi:hypothetical protein